MRQFQAGKLDGREADFGAKRRLCTPGSAKECEAKELQSFAISSGMNRKPKSADCTESAPAPKAAPAASTWLIPEARG